VTLRDHLRAHQNLCLAARHTRHHGFEFVATSNDVAIESGDSNPRESFSETFFDALSALTDGLHSVAALGALAWQVAIGTAVMAAQSCRLTVYGHARITRLAGRHPATGRAGESRGIAASIDVHENLTVRGEMTLDGGYGSGG